MGKVSLTVNTKQPTKMKICAFVFVAVSIIGACSAAPYNGPQCVAPGGKGGLQAVAEEFFALLPAKQLVKIYLAAVSTDPEVQAVVDYLGSQDFHDLVAAVQNLPEFYKVLNYVCDELYLDLYYYFTKINSLIGLPPVTRPLLVHMNLASTDRRPGFRGMLLDMLDVIPVDKIKALFKEKLDTDVYFQKFIALLKSDDVKNLVRGVKAMPEYQKILDSLRGMNVEIDQVLEVLRKFFGWD